MKTATWYPVSGLVVISTKTSDVTLMALTWDKAVRLAKWHGCSEITDTLKRWTKTF